MWVGVEVAVGFDEEVFGEALVYRSVADKYIDGTGIHGILGAGLRLDGMVCLDGSVATMKLIYGSSWGILHPPSSSKTCSLFPLPGLSLG